MYAKKILWNFPYGMVYSEKILQAGAGERLRLSLRRGGGLVPDPSKAFAERVSRPAPELFCS